MTVDGEKRGVMIVSLQGGQREHRKLCEARLPRFLYDYISGGSYQENTLHANIADLQITLLRQRVLVDESHLNFSIDLWGQALSLPVDRATPDLLLKD
jgi:isopentenyl diphosphate isomerase/L-lactate dehydrogenase-like FMN-dependent dehydrogenase